MTTTNNFTSINEVLKTLDEINQGIYFVTSLPSYGTDVKSKVLTTEQLKRVFKSLVDSPLQNSLFTQTINQIVRENIIDINTDDLTVLDKLVYIISLRSNSISPLYTVSLTEEEKKQNDVNGNVSAIVDLVGHLNDVLKDVKKLEDVSVSISPYELICSIPTIQTENVLEGELHKNLNVEINTQEELRTFIGDTFINEITKYIKSLTVNSQVIPFAALDFKSRISIVSKLPSTLINKVLKYMEEYKNLSDKFTKVTVESVDSKGELVKIEKELPIDASFFNE